MAQLIITVPDNQAAFARKVNLQLGFDVAKSTADKSLNGTAKTPAPVKFDDLPDADKAKALRKILKEKKDIKPVLRDVVSGLADVYEGKPMKTADEFLKEARALDRAEGKLVDY